MPPNIVPGWPPQRGQRIDQGLFHTYSIGPAAGGPGGGTPGIGNPQMVDPQQRKMLIPPGGGVGGGGGPGPGGGGGLLGGEPFGGMGGPVFGGLGQATGALLPGIGMAQGGLFTGGEATVASQKDFDISNAGMGFVVLPMGVPPEISMPNSSKVGSWDRTGPMGGAPAVFSWANPGPVMPRVDAYDGGADSSPPPTRPITVTSEALVVGEPTEDDSRTSLTTTVHFLVDPVPPCERGYQVIQRKSGVMYFPRRKGKSQPAPWVVPGPSEEVVDWSVTVRNSSISGVSGSSAILWSDFPGLVTDFAQYAASGQYRFIQRFNTRVIDRCTGAVVAQQFWSVRTTFYVLLDGTLGSASSVVSTQ